MNPKAYVAEFIATFALIFVGVGAIAADAVTGGKLGLTGIALAHGLTIAVMVGAIGSVSGGHINPAVTIAAWTAGKISLPNAVAYLISQCLGGLAGAIAITWVVPQAVLSSVGLGTPVLGEGITTSQGLLAEIFMTFLLMFVIYGVAIDKRGAGPVAGLFIGLTITLDILMGGPITGAAMNPARHFGPAIVGGLMHDWWLYWLGPILGAVIAAQVYKRVLEEEK